MLERKTLDFPTKNPDPHGFMQNPLPDNIRSARETAWKEGDRLRVWKIMAHYLRWTIESLYKIKTQSGEVVPFRLHNLQLRQLDDLVYELFELKRPVRWAKGKPRRIGESTFWTAVLHELTRFQRHQSTLIMSNKAGTTQALYRMIQLYEEQMRISAEDYPLLRIPLRQKNLNMMRWEDFDPERDRFVEEGGSFMRLETGGSGNKGAAGDAFRLVLYDECGDDAVDWDQMTGVNDQCVPYEAGTIIIKTGAAYGDDGAKQIAGTYLKQLRDQCLAGVSGYTWKFDAWWEFEGYRGDIEPGEEVGAPSVSDPTLKNRYQEEIDKVYGLAWEKWGVGGLSGEAKSAAITEINRALKWMLTDGLPNRCSGDFDLFHLQYPATDIEMFTSRSSLYFNGAELNKRITRTLEIDSPSLRGDYVRVKYPPEVNTKYLVVCDPSSGHADDPVAGWVFNTKRLRLEATIDGALDPEEFAREVAAIGNEYSLVREDPITGEKTTVAPAIAAVEVTGGWGDSMVTYLRGLDYGNIWRRPMRAEWAGDKPAYGFSTNNKSRDVAVTLLRRQWETWQIDFTHVLHQWGNVAINSKGKAEGRGRKDDHHFACGFMTAYICELNDWIKDDGWQPGWESPERAAVVSPITLLDTLRAKRERLIESGDGSPSFSSKLAAIDERIEETSQKNIDEVQSKEPWRAINRFRSPDPSGMSKDWRTSWINVKA